MAKTIDFDIDGFIGAWGYSNRYVKGYLNSAGNNPVICRVCSYGGDFMMAMNIKDEFARHGDVTVDISGYAASAATLIGLGAKHVRISSTSFYLIHKVMSWVAAFGNLNDDQIADVIAELEKTKDENAKMTLVAAQAYAEKSGKPVSGILALMKEEKWLTAEEAKEWGFVDEVYNSVTKLNVAGMCEKFNMMGMPPLPTPVDTPEEQERQPIINQKKREMKVFNKVNAALGVEALESTDGKGVYLNEEQLDAIETSMTASEGRITTLQGHETALNDATANLDGLHPDVAAATGIGAKVTVIREKLAKKPGEKPAGAQAPKPVDTTDGVDWETLNSLPHMQENPGEII